MEQHLRITLLHQVKDSAGKTKTNRVYLEYNQLNLLKNHPSLGTSRQYTPGERFKSVFMAFFLKNVPETRRFYFRKLTQNSQLRTKD